MKYYFYIPKNENRINCMLFEDHTMAVTDKETVDYWNNPKALLKQSREQVKNIEWLKWHYQIINHLIEIYGWDKYLTFCKD